MKSWVWGLAFAIAGAVLQDTQASTSPPTLDPSTVMPSTAQHPMNTIAIAVALGDAPNRIDSEKQRKILEFLHARKISYKMVTVVAGAQTVEVEDGLLAGGDKALQVNHFSVSDITNFLEVDENEKPRSGPTYLLIDRCTGLERFLKGTDTMFSEVLNFEPVKSSYYGYFINYTYDIAPIRGSYHSLTLTVAIAQKMTPDHAYFVTSDPLDMLTRVNTTHRLCNGFYVNTRKANSTTRVGSFSAHENDTASVTSNPIAVSVSSGQSVVAAAPVTLILLTIAIGIKIC